jgi:hypothetical protein
MRGEDAQRPVYPPMRNRHIGRYRFITLEQRRNTTVVGPFALTSLVRLDEAIRVERCLAQGGKCRSGLRVLHLNRSQGYR